MKGMPGKGPPEARRPGPSETSPISTYELSVAAEIQRRLLPKRTPQIVGFELDAYYNPSASLGGDYYDYIEIDPEHLGIVVADISGKGIPAALLMAQARTLLRAEVKTSISPREVMTRMNRGLAGEIPGGMFVTMFYAVLNIPKSQLAISNCGHNKLLLWRAAKRSCAEVTTEGMAVGIDKTGKRFEKAVRERIMAVEPGDRFVLYTDGVTEAMNGADEEFGLTRLVQRFQQSTSLTCAQFMKGLMADVKAFRGRAAQSDDITVIAVRRLGEASAAKAPPRLVSSDRYIACSFCEAVNLRGDVECTVCREPLEKLDQLKLTAHSNELECPCGTFLRLEARAAECSNCGKLMCGRCLKAFAEIGALCHPCFVHVRDAPEPPRAS